MERDIRRYGLLGDPVAHSISPALYAAAFARLGVRATYEARRVTSAEVPPAMQEFAATGGGNVTLPHKARAAAALDERSAAVADTGACNCFWQGPGGRLAGENTDVAGFLAAVAEDSPVGLRGRSVLLLGAGGAARAVLAACAYARAARVWIRNRTQERAMELAERFRSRALQVGVVDPGDVPAGRFDLVVNATSLGLKSADPLPIPPERVGAAAALDLVYARGGTRWVRRWRALGVPARDGRGMLVHQAALSIRCWLGVDGPLDALRRAADRALESGEADATRPDSDGRFPEASERDGGKR